MKELTLSPNSLKVLSVLISSAKEHHLHSLASLTRLSVMGISKIIKQLEKKQVVAVTKIGRTHLIKLNKTFDNLLFFCLAEQYKFREFLKKHQSLKGFLLQLREKLQDKSDFSLIFGSYASGEQSTKSDLDILIVSSHKKEISKILKTVSILLDTELSPVIITQKEFVEQTRKKHRLYQEILQGKRILISGEYDFWRLFLEL